MGELWVNLARFILTPHRGDQGFVILIAEVNNDDCLFIILCLHHIIPMETHKNIKSWKYTNYLIV